MASKPTDPTPGTPKLPNIRKKGLSNYFKEVGIEMRKVIWPSRQETLRLTSAVLLVCVVFVLYLYIASELVHLIISLLEKGKV